MRKRKCLSSFRTDNIVLYAFSICSMRKFHFFDGREGPCDMRLFSARKVEQCEKAHRREWVSKGLSISKMVASWQKCLNQNGFGFISYFSAFPFSVATVEPMLRDYLTQHRHRRHHQHERIIKAPAKGASTVEKWSESKGGDVWNWFNVFCRFEFFIRMKIVE